MALTITVRTGNLTTPSRVTLDAPRLVIGRGDGCEIRLPDPSVSHRHASIRQRGADYLVVDEGSTNGTFIGQVRLSPQSPRVLRSGELLRVGRIWLEVTVEHAVPASNAAMATKELALALVAQALESHGEAASVRVTVIEGPDSGRELDLAELGRSYVVGRGQGVDLALDDADASRRHLELTRRGDRLSVRDLGSKNGTWLDERALTPDQETPWRAGETLRIGADRLVYEDPVSLALEELERAADERMREDESVEPPGAAPELERAAPAERLETAPTGRDGPIAEVPVARPRAPRARTGWNSTDVLVAFLALVVILLSVAGLWWLFRTG